MRFWFLVLYGWLGGWTDGRGVDDTGSFTHLCNTARVYPHHGLLRALHFTTRAFSLWFHCRTHCAHAALVHFLRFAHVTFCLPRTCLLGLLLTLTYLSTAYYVAHTHFLLHIVRAFRHFQFFYCGHCYLLHFPPTFTHSLLYPLPFYLLSYFSISNLTFYLFLYLSVRLQFDSLTRFLPLGSWFGRTTWPCPCPHPPRLSVAHALVLRALHLPPRF